MQLNYHIRNRDTDQPCVKAIRQALAGKDTVYIVGKGPSLDSLTADDFSEFPSAPILCINEAIHAIEKLNLPSSRLFCVQYDRLRGDNRPARGKWLLSSFAFDDQHGESAGAIRYDLKDVAPTKPNLTAATALSIAALAGANQAVMLAFDAAFGGNCDYAASIGHGPDLPGQHPRRFVRFDEVGIPSRAAEEGMRLIWQAPKSFWVVALVLRSGGSYTMQHVDAIRQQIDNHLKTPHGIILLTDQPDARAWRRIPLATDWPGWFAKLELFRPDIRFRGGVLFTDLDNFFGRDFSLPTWDTLHPGCLYMPCDPYRDMYISCLMAWRLGTVTAPYEQFADRPITKHPEIKVFSDQEIINATCDIIPLDWIPTASWKKDRPKPADVDCVLFHGTPKPWDVGLVDIGNIIEAVPVVQSNHWHDPHEKAKAFLQKNPRFAKRGKTL